MMVWEMGQASEPHTEDRESLSGADVQGFGTSRGSQGPGQTCSQAWSLGGRIRPEGKQKHKHKGGDHIPGMKGATGTGRSEFKPG